MTYVDSTGALPPFMEEAQKVSLMGDYLNAPYVQLGADPPPYNLDNQVPLNELKAALKALAAFHADPSLSPTDTATETIWRAITVDDGCVDPSDLSCGTGWDPAAADEFALAISRYRNLWDIKGPFARVTAGGLQPTATGLELIAGAVNKLLGGYPKMALYEKWRGGVFEPPSTVSSPDVNTPVLPVNYFGPTYRRAPPEVLQEDADLYQRLYAAEAELAQTWVGAAKAPSEGARTAWQHAMIERRRVRDGIVDEAIRNAKARAGELVIDRATIQACLDMGGQWDAGAKACKAAPPLRTGAAPASAAGAGISTLGLVAVGGAVAGSVLLYKRWKSKR